MRPRWIDRGIPSYKIGSRDKTHAEPPLSHKTWPSIEGPSIQLSWPSSPPGPARPCHKVGRRFASAPVPHRVALAHGNRPHNTPTHIQTSPRRALEIEGR